MYCPPSLSGRFLLIGATLYPPKWFSCKGWRLWGIFYPTKTWINLGHLQLAKLGCQLRSQKAEHWKEGFTGDLCSSSVHFMFLVLGIG